MHESSAPAEVPALFRRYPQLQGRLPRVPLLDGPTAVHRLPGIERAVGRPGLWIKRDDRSARPYGGNKPRKLEFLLGDARARRARHLVTFGGLGSHHALATALYGRRHGFRVTAILVPQPITDGVRQNLALLQALGAVTVRTSASRLDAARAAVLAWLAATLRGEAPYVVPPGGSSPLGTVGYVSAGLELAEQVAAGELPAPGAVYVACGSNGTAAGLLLGLRLGGLSSTLVAVRVSDRLRVDARRVASLARDALALLRKHAAISRVEVAASDVRVVEGFLGPGYGHPTPEAEEAVALAREAEGLTLEITYTGKALAAFLEAARATGSHGERPLLFWHTYNSHPLEDLLRETADG